MAIGLMNPHFGTMNLNFFLKNQDSKDDGLFFMDYDSYLIHYESIIFCNLMFGSIIRIYYIDENLSTKLLFFNLNIFEPCEIV